MTAKIIDFAAARAARYSISATGRGTARTDHAPSVAEVLPAQTLGNTRTCEAFRPAYSDPANEKRGSKFDRNLSAKEIAARVRAEIKAEIKAKRLPVGFKASVKSDTFAGGQSIDVRITSAPGLTIVNREWLTHNRDMPYENHNIPHMTQEASDLVKRLERMMNQYNRDNSDSSVDYFDVHFYSHVTFDYDLTHAEHEAFKKGSPK